MTHPVTYDTLSQAVEGLKALGYDQDLDLQKEGLSCSALGYEMKPSDFEVDQVHRFEGMTNPADSSVVYAISSEKYDLKGILVDAYGTYAEPPSMEMLQKLKYEPN